MSQYVVTFFGRDDKRRRFKLFPAKHWSGYDENGDYYYWYGMHPQTIAEMLDYFDNHPLSGMLRSYGIPWALTDISTSSIIVDLKSNDPEAEEEMLVTLKMFAGPDIRIAVPEAIPRPRTDRERRVALSLSEPDRYAR